MNRDTADISLKTPFPGTKAEALVARDKKVQAKATDCYAFVRAFDGEAIGPFCTDVDDNVVLDFTGQIGCNPLGYNHPEVKAMVVKAAPYLAMAKYAGTDFYGAWNNGLPSPTDFKERIIEATKQFGFDRVFMSNSGAEAVENALKICYAKRGRGYGIGFDGAFHGRTLALISLNQSKLNHKRNYPPLGGIKTIKYAGADDGTNGINYGFWVHDAGLGMEISELEQILKKHAPEEIDYILMEPMQGEGGYIVPSKRFVEEIKRVCSTYKIPLIADEVQSGMGRTGKLWAVEHFGIMPDVITSAKAMQIGATMARSDMFPTEPARISSTWGGGDIINSIIGFQTLEIIMRDKLWENAERMGNYFMDQLRGLQTKYSFITDVRGLGLMNAIEFDVQNKRTKFEGECFNRGLMVIGCGYKALRFLPPLDVTQRELDIALNVIDDALKAI